MVIYIYFEHMARQEGGDGNLSLVERDTVSVDVVKTVMSPDIKKENKAFI